MHDVFARWNKGPLDSYLIEITRDILGFTDPETGKPMIDLILDTAGQKGTGKWTVITACDLGVPLTLIAEAVFARTLSSQKDERVAASKVLKSHPRPLHRQPPGHGRRPRAGPLRQQDHLLRPGLQPDERHGEGVELGDQQRRRRPDVARRLHHPQRLPGPDQGGLRPQSRSWRTCCSTPTSPSEISRAEESWRRVCAAAITHGIPLPAMTSALSYFDGYRDREPAGQPAAGPARLLRRPHLRARRPAARPVLPHQLDRPGRHHGVDGLQRLSAVAADTPDDE